LNSLFNRDNGHSLNNVGLKITQWVVQLWDGRAPSQLRVILTQCIWLKVTQQLTIYLYLLH